MRPVVLSEAVEAQLTPVERAQVVNPQRLVRARCAICNRWAEGDEVMAISVIVGRNVKRTFATHPACSPSTVLVDDSGDPVAVLPSEGFDAIALPMVRRLAPHAVVAIEFTGSLVSPAGPSDVIDIFISRLLELGFALVGHSEEDVPRPSGWRAVFADGELEVVDAEAVPLYQGPIWELSPWVEAIERAGELVVVAGSLLGTRDADPAASIAAAMAAGRVVGGIIPIHRRVKVTERNAPCPCGSGRKYKHCHGGMGRGSPPNRQPE